MKIVVDAMGGDNGSPAVVEAVKNYLKKHEELEITVVGKKEELTELEGICEIVDARDVVPMEAGALEVMRMKDSSMYKAVSMVKSGEYSAVVSCGSTGGFLSTATLLLKNIEGVKRSALVVPFPTKIKGKKVVLLDVGANNENSAEELLQFGTIGKLYSRYVYDVEKPNVYLMSNGAEEGKGSPVVKEAYKLYQENKFEGFNGNIEARYALVSDADVIVMDGFTGNVFLKGTEGTAKFMGGLIKAAFKRNIFSKIGYLLTRKGVKEMSDTMDYKSTGGAMLLGVNGVVVKAHGSSDAWCFENAIRVAHTLASADIVNKIKEGLKSE